MSEVEDLRRQLRERGYLSHGIERWFALDPWSSRTFWLELAIVALKAATLIAAFGALPLTAVMLFRNRPLGAFETLALFLSYAAVWFAMAFILVMAVALILKVRPALPIETPRALLAISLGAAALLASGVALWWYGFETAPALPELAIGSALSVVLLVVSTIVISAALLSFSIYEVHRVPAIHSKPRGLPMTVAAAFLIALLFVPAYAEREPQPAEPMVVTTPTERHVALIAVDGLTWQILQSRSDLTQQLPHRVPVRTIEAASTTERWASVGTGVGTGHHGVRAIEGVRFRGGSHVLQRISRNDFILMSLLPMTKIARREPLPPTIRRRDYVWEILAERGVPAAAVNWWATSSERTGALTSIGPETIFAAAGADPVRVDAIATLRFRESIDKRPRFATVYLPGLDVILNRIGLDTSAELASSLRALDGVARAVALARERGYQVVLVGMPGDRQSGGATVASTVPFRGSSAWDVAPAMLELMGFPLSKEMPGGSPSQERIATYGPRTTDTPEPTLNEEYYESLKSLGYIQ